MEMDEDYLRSTSNINDGFNQLLDADIKRDFDVEHVKWAWKGGALQKNEKLRVLSITQCRV
jgi:hypothetical protein